VIIRLLIALIRSDHLVSCPAGSIGDNVISESELVSAPSVLGPFVCRSLKSHNAQVTKTSGALGIDPEQDPARSHLIPFDQTLRQVFSADFELISLSPMHVLYF
jgi:hypothetical protein